MSLASPSHASASLVSPSHASTSLASPSHASSTLRTPKPKLSYEEEEFWWACNSNDLGQLDHVLQTYPSMPLTTPSLNGVTPLYIAAYNNSNDVLSLLVTSHTPYIDIDQPNLKTGLTPLHGACAAGNLSAVKLLVKKGANINQESFNGTRPYDTAVYMRRPGIVSFLDHCKGLDTVHNDTSLHVEMWTCHVCTKNNTLEHSHCVVCGRANVLLEHAEEERSKMQVSVKEEAMKEWLGDEATGDEEATVGSKDIGAGLNTVSVMSELTDMDAGKAKKPSSIRFG